MFAVIMATLAQVISSFSILIALLGIICVSVLFVLVVYQCLRGFLIGRDYDGYE
jgi:hypothetical protein